MQSSRPNASLNPHFSRARTLNNLANNATDSQDYAEAQALYRESLLTYSELGDKLGLAECLADQANLECSLGNVERAARIWGAVEALRVAIGSPMAPGVLDEHHRIVNAARAQLNPARWAAAWAEGQAMPVDEAVQYATSV